MTKVVLPKLNQTGANLWSSVQSNDEAIAEVVNGGLSNENIASGAAIARSKLEGGAQGVAGTWYAPVINAAEQSANSPAFTNLSTPDEISGVVLPTNGLIVVGYSANIKSSVSSAGAAAIFIGSNQVKIDAGGAAPAAQFVSTSGTTFHHISTNSYGLALVGSEVWTGDVTTGQILGAANSGVALGGGPIHVFAAAGTYTVSVKYGASSGTVTAKERKLWVWVLGV